MNNALVIGTALFAPLVAGSAAAQQPRPNVILVLTDDQGYGDMSCHGNPYIQTPNIDKLYGESVRLTNFHVDATSSPTRASIMTGKYSSRTGVWHTLQGRSIMDAGEVTMAEIFRDNGYKTGIFGKWHLGDSYPYHPSYRGFDESVIHGGGGVGQNPDYWRNDYFDDVYMHNREWKLYKGYCTDVWFDLAREFIRENRDEPFFCMIPTNAPHFWYFVPDHYTQPYRQAGMPDQRTRFFGMIACIDENLGLMREELEDLGIADNTIFIFMTDNGTGFMRRDGYFYNAGMRGGKATIYEGGHRVPFFIHYKDGKLTHGEDIAALTAHIDILPTLIELCGLDNPYQIDFDGISLAGQLSGKVPATGHESLVVHHQRVDKPEKYKDYCVMQENWRMINGHELYDLKTDPGQADNIASKHPGRVKDMLTVYEKWWTRNSDHYESYSEIYLGAPEEPVSWLTCHDWHSDELLWTWHQDSIRATVHGNGYWTVKIVRDGDYDITLRTYPVEEDTKMQVQRVKLSIGDKQWEKNSYVGSSQVTLTVPLRKGSYRMQTWMYDLDGRDYGAPYAYVKYRESP